jgi:hypothetical protein
MKRTIKKRLTLDRDTVKTLVAELSAAEIRGVRGGALEPPPVHPRSGGTGTDPVARDFC